MRLIILLVAVAAANARYVDRVVGGGLANNHEYPWQLSLQVLSLGRWVHNCGATLIDRNSALTAAHCVQGWNPGSMRVVAGLHTLDTADSDSSLSISTLSAWTQHENYEHSGNYPNDIATMTLSGNILEGTGISFANLATSGDYDNQFCYISGWGHTSGGGSLSNTLKEGRMEVLSTAECRGYWGIANIRADHICMYEGSTVSACQGDSGGPAQCGTTQVGVTSWVASGCLPTYPSVYTRVTSFNAWIGANS